MIRPTRITNLEKFVDIGMKYSKKHIRLVGVGVDGTLDNSAKFAEFAAFGGVGV